VIPIIIHTQNYHPTFHTTMLPMLNSRLILKRNFRLPDERSCAEQLISILEIEYLKYTFTHQKI